MYASKCAMRWIRHAPEESGVWITCSAISTAKYATTRATAGCKMGRAKMICVKFYASGSLTHRTTLMNGECFSIELNAGIELIQDS